MSERDEMIERIKAEIEHNKRMSVGLDKTAPVFYAFCQGSITAYEDVLKWYKEIEECEGNMRRLHRFVRARCTR